MLKIYKYSLGEPSFYKRSFLVPRTWKHLSTQLQNGNLCLWGIVDSTSPVDRLITLECYVTGQEIENSPDLHFIATLQDGEYVAHIFERRDNA